MKLIRSLHLVLLVQFFTCTSVFAGDFDWLKELNVTAKADSSGFQTTLATRFKIGDAEIKAVFSNVDRPADAYMVLRLGELSHRSTDYVLKQYRVNKNKGWGVLAKSLGIKPGSREFHALKAGHDLRHHGESHHGAAHSAANKSSKNHRKDSMKGKSRANNR